MGLLGGIARTAVFAGTATAVSNRVSRRQANRWAAKDQSAYAQPQYVQQAPPPAPQPAEEDMTVRLTKLGQLHANGVLSDDEFTAAKAKILGI
jgi:hypothetical protein